MKERLATLLERGRDEISAAADPERVGALRVKYLGKKGELSQVLGGMGKLPPEERRALGEVANAAKAELEELLAKAARRAEDARLEQDLRGPKLDVSLPGRGLRPGRRHPVSRTMDDMVKVFARLGFEVRTGPEIELDYYNFEALNFPHDHPARDMQDTFFVSAPWVGKDADHPGNPVVLRTHTSPVQIRTMLEEPPPVRAIMPGRVYRRDSDLTHTPMFHQLEGLMVDRGVTMGELKGTLDAFVKAMFGAEVKTRFRPSFFPFTEPSAEVDISCVRCKGKGCRVCKQSGWLEVLGCGMVHPNLYRNVGYDAEQVQGFAFGMGIDRITMLRYQMDDLRTLFENDVRFLEQF
ncbi:MAG TPA: phenylalanine--tRNA ligase subunit alpha [Myxococcales bacterium]|nr:phenylalanine--tRNA ligase subunit alpha [Myxococcales bacterium]